MLRGVIFSLDWLFMGTLQTCARTSRALTHTLLVRIVKVGLISAELRRTLLRIWFCRTILSWSAVGVRRPFPEHRSLLGTGSHVKLALRGLWAVARWQWLLDMRSIAIVNVEDSEIFCFEI